MEKKRFPTEFVAQMEQVLGKNPSEFFSVLCEGRAPTSIRSNVQKTKAVPFGNAHEVPWCDGAFWLDERPVFTLDPTFHAGGYYVQEASSMLIAQAVGQFLSKEKPLVALDMCAAPGGKSTLLLDALPKGSMLVSNEIINNRNAVLRENLERWGSPNVAICSEQAEQWANVSSFFDVILADAPCSGEGLFRKDYKAVEEWSPSHVAFCASRQKSILAPLVDALKPNGLLLYSTCTYNFSENQDNVRWLIEQFPLEVLPLTLDADWGFQQQTYGIQAFPHRVRGEGLFLAVLRKKDVERGKKVKAPKHFSKITPLSKKQLGIVQPWMDEAERFEFFESPKGEILALPKAHLDHYLALDSLAAKKHFGTAIGSIKGKDFVPAHALALSAFIGSEVQKCDLDKENALLFLKKEPFELPEKAPVKGWVLMCYNGLGLGWIKRLPNRMNNYLPMNRRILMDL